MAKKVAKKVAVEVAGPTKDQLECVIADLNADITRLAGLPKFANRLTAMRDGLLKILTADETKRAKVTEKLKAQFEKLVTKAKEQGIDPATLV